MAYPTPATTVTTEGTFIPELWSDEIIATYKKSVILANLVRNMAFQGKKGDTVHVPKPVRGSAHAKLAETQVTLNANTAGELVISIDKHYEYSRLIEDIVNVQALPSHRAFYTSDAGYALSLQVESDLLAVAKEFGAGSETAGTNYSNAVAAGDGETAWDSTGSGNGTAITDVGIRNMLQTLEDASVPIEGLKFFLPPVAKNQMLGVDRFVNVRYVDNKPVQNGQFGEIYGVPIFASANADTVTAADGTTKYRAGLLFHQDAIVHVEQLAVRSQVQYKQEHLSDLLTSDTIYGVSIYRPESGIAFMLPA